MSRYKSEVDLDARYDDRRSTRGGRYEDHRDVDINFRTGGGATPRERVVYKERDDFDRKGSTPAFLRDDYGQTNAGAMVLRAREREDVTYAPPRRRRSPSPEKREREEIIIRRDERSESRPPAPRAPPPPRQRDHSHDREEIIIRRDERSQSKGPSRHRGRDGSHEREEIIIRRDEVDNHSSYAPPSRSRTAPPREVSREREEIIIRRDERDTRSRFDDDVVSRRSYKPPPPPAREHSHDREEIIIRRNHEDSAPPPRSRYEDNMALARPISHERSRGRSDSFSDEEIIIRRDEKEGRGRDSTRQEIIIRRHSHSRSPSPTASISTRPAPPPEPAAPPPPQIIYAPQIHQEVITHHRHVDHGYEVRQPVYSRPASSPSPPPAPVPPPPQSVRSESEERIEIRRSETRNGRRENEDIIITRNERSRSRGPPARRYERDDLEIDYRKRDYEEDYRQPRYQPEPEYVPEPTIGARFGARRDPRDGLWTEVTKDLVVKDAIKEMGYEFEESDDFYYIFKYMQYEDVAHLVGLSEDIRKNRHKRINQIRWENNVAPQSAIEPARPRAPLAIEGPPSRGGGGRQDWNHEDERYIEREVVYRGGRPPPPPGWRR